MPRQNVFFRLFRLGMVDQRERKRNAVQQGESTEIFSSAIISNDKPKEGECRVDGLLVVKNGKSIAESFQRVNALMFLGCNLHRCPQCYRHRLEVNEKRKRNMGELLLVSVE